MRPVAALLLIALAACSNSDPAASAPSPAPSPAPDGRKDAESGPPARLDVYRYSGPHARGNLAVYLLIEKGAATGDLGCLTLEDALKSGAVKVSEKAEGAEVNELQIENSGDKPVYLQAGDTVKGGKQDRTIAVDTILPPKSGKRTIDAFCVEPGRWSSRDSQGVSSGATFALSEESAPVATKEQKLAVRLSKSQNDVWEAGKKVNQDLVNRANASPQQGGGASLAFVEPKNSYVEAVEDPGVAKKVNETVAALSTIVDGHPDAVGAAFCVNGKVQNIEIYAASGLFRKLWPKLLRAAAVEAFSKSKEGEAAKPPAEAELQATLVGLEGQKGRAELRKEGPVVRIFECERAVLFDTENGGKLLHRQLLTK
jgi:hypothetical protein